MVDYRRRRCDDPAARLVGEVGDLRPAHFLALHAMQVLPLVGWWIDRRGGASLRALHSSAAAWALLTVAVFAQALAGLPLLRL